MTPAPTMMTSLRVDMASLPAHNRALSDDATGNCWKSSDQVERRLTRYLHSGLSDVIQSAAPSLGDIHCDLPVAMSYHDDRTRESKTAEPDGNAQ